MTTLATAEAPPPQFQVIEETLRRHGFGVEDARSLLNVAPRQALIDWDWGATGIWGESTPEEGSAPVHPGRWLPYTLPSDRHRAWRGLLSDDLIDALQAWNDRGEEVMGAHAHEHTDEERAEFWARGRDLAAQAQQQLGPDYEVVCRSRNPSWSEPARRCRFHA